MKFTLMKLKGTADHATPLQLFLLITPSFIQDEPQFPFQIMIIPFVKSRSLGISSPFHVLTATRIMFLTFGKFAIGKWELKIPRTRPSLIVLL